MTSNSFARANASADSHRLSRLPSQAFRLVAANATRVGVQLLLIPVLARIVRPEAFGQVAIATPLIIFTSILAEAGLVTGLVRSRVSPAAESTAFWFSAAGGALCAALVALLAWPIGQLAHQPALPRVLWALSPALLLTCLTIVPSARLQRTGAFGAFALSEFLSCLAGAAAALWTALHGWGALALVSQQLAQAGMRLLANACLSRFRPGLTFSYAALKPILAQSTPLLGSNLLAYLSRSLDNLLIGVWIGPKALGFYSQAYNSVLISEFALGAAMRTAAMPAIAHAPDRNAAAGVYLKGMRTISLLATPVVIGACMKADALVALVLGPAWAPAAPLVAILTPLGVLHAYFQLNTAALIGLGQVKSQLRLSVLTSVLGLLGIVAGFSWGAQGVALGYGAGTALAALPYFRCVLRDLNLPWRGLVSGAGRSWIAGTVMIAALSLLDRFAPAQPALWDVVVAASVGLAAYAFALLALELVRPAYLAPRPRPLAIA